MILVSATVLVFAALDPLHPLEMIAKRAMQPRIIPKTTRFPIFTFTLIGLAAAADTIDQDLGEIPCRLLVRDLQKILLLVPQYVVERMVKDHSYERTDHHPRIYFAHRPIFLSLLH